MKQVCLNPLGSLKYPWKIGSLLFLLFNLYTFLPLFSFPFSSISLIQSVYSSPSFFLLSLSPFLPFSFPSISLIQYVYSSSFPFPSFPFPLPPSISLINLETLLPLFPFPLPLLFPLFNLYTLLLPPSSFLLPPFSFPLYRLPSPLFPFLFSPSSFMLVSVLLVSLIQFL